MVLRDGFMLKVGNGVCSFWYEPWHTNTCLCDVVPCVDIHDIELKVRDLVSNGDWQLEGIFSWLPETISNSIKSTVVHLNEHTPYCFIWDHSLSGMYTVKAGYKWISDQSNEVSADNRSWNWIWKMQVPENIRFLVWLVSHDAIPTNELRLNRGIYTSAECTRCRRAVETTMHCLRECDISKQIWNKIGVTGSALAFSITDPMDWCLHIYSKYGVRGMVALWWIWRVRNFEIFQSLKIPIEVVLQNINMMEKLCKEAYIASHQGHDQRWITWDNSQGLSMIMNVDGSCIGNIGGSGNAGFGGLLRNQIGDCVLGFYGSCGFSNCLHAELLAIFNGHQIAWDRGITSLECQSDSKLGIKLIQDQSLSPFHKFATIIQSIRELLARQWNVSLRHVLREGNQCADFLAKMGSSSVQKLVLLDQPPSDLAPILMADSLGVEYLRL